jgi:hypothetical protein
MDHSAMTVQEIPVVGTGPVEQGAKEGLEVQEAQEAQDLVDAGNNFIQETEKIFWIKLNLSDKLKGAQR